MALSLENSGERASEKLFFYFPSLFFFLKEVSFSFFQPKIPIFFFKGQSKPSFQSAASGSEPFSTRGKAFSLRPGRLPAEKKSVPRSDSGTSECQSFFPLRFSVLRRRRRQKSSRCFDCFKKRNIFFVLRVRRRTKTMEPTPIRRMSSGGLAQVPLEGPEEESPRRRLFASAAKDIVGVGARGGACCSTARFPPVNSSAPSSSVVAASTPPALASLLAPLAGGSPQALCCAGVSPRALFGGGRSVNPEGMVAMASTKRELVLPPFSSPSPAAPAVEFDDGDEAGASAERANNNMGGLVAATHAVSLLFLYLP